MSPVTPLTFKVVNRSPLTNFELTVRSGDNAQRYNDSALFEEGLYQINFPCSDRLPNLSLTLEHLRAGHSSEPRWHSRTISWQELPKNDLAFTIVIAKDFFFPGHVAIPGINIGDDESNPPFE